MLKKLFKIGLIFSFLLVLPVSALAFTTDCYVDNFCPAYCSFHCPEPIEHSYYISNTCDWYDCPVCEIVEGVYCLFECDEGYEYVGEECVLEEEPAGGVFTFGSAEIGSTLEYTGKLLTDLEVAIILVIGLPVAFFVIRKIILLPKQK